MKSYKTYRECKIANPECEVAVVTGCDEFTPPLGEFIAVLKSDGLSDGYAFADESKLGSPNIGDGYYKICNPADYCMTVEEFLRAGHKFVEGDLIITESGVLSVGRERENMGCSVSECNEPSCVDSDIYILRAAALGKPRQEIHKDSEFYKKPRTKVEFVRVEDSIWCLEAAFKCGELFAFDGVRDYVQIETEGDFTLSHSVNNLYRRIETPMTEREAFIEALNEVAYGDDGFISTSELFSRIVDSGKFKLVN